MLKEVKRYFLCVDLSTAHGTCSLFEEGDSGDSANSLILEKVVSEEGNHSEAFLKCVNEIMNETKISLSEWNKLMTTSGPGSFTGLRIAVSSLKALALSLNIPIVAMKSSEARAFAFLKENPQTKQVKVITRLTSTKFHYSTYSNQKEKLEEVVTEDRALLSNDTATVLTDDADSTEFIHYPIRSRYLGLLFPDTKHQTTYRSQEELILFSPQYFGDSFKPMVNKICDKVKTNF